MKKITRFLYSNTATYLFQPYFFLSPTLSWPLMRFTLCALNCILMISFFVCHHFSQIRQTIKRLHWQRFPMQALSWMQSISPIHPNRPALLRCYINRATLPSTASLGPPKAGDWCQQGILSHISFNLLQTHPEKHWHQHRGPQWALNGPAELHYPCATFS